MILLRNLFLFIALAGLTGPLAAQTNTSDSKTVLHGAHRDGKRNDASMQAWRDAGLGQFLHWGLYSLYGGQYNGKDYNYAAEFIRGFVPVKEYDQVYKTFNPKNFNPEEWARIAKRMGVKVMYFTTKHHDGFCLWPSKYSKYTVAQTPYKKDIVKQVVDAYNKQGIDVHLYYSILDWTHPDNHITLKTPEDYAANERFKVFVKNQLTELVKNYPTIKGLWFDGTWDDFWKKSGAFSDSLEQYLKSLNPDLIIGSRLRADEYGNRHIDGNGKLMGDYWQTWERKLPQSIEDLKGRDWEFITTLGENGWGYQKHYLGHLKTVPELIEMIVKSVSLDGNAMINFGPTGDGTIRPEEVAIADSIGAWMDKNNVVVYHSGYAKGWVKQDWGYFTKNDQTGKTYMTVFNVPVSKKLRVTAPKGTLIQGAKFYVNGKKLHVEKLDGTDYFIHLPDELFNESFVIELQLTEGALKNNEKDALT